MKKNILLDKFVLYALLFKGNAEYRDVAWRIIHELGIENGVKIEDFTVEDFNDTGISHKRRQQFSDILNDGECASPAMIVDYLIYVGSKEVEKLKNKISNDRKDKNRESVLKQIGFTISKKSYDKVLKLAVLSGRNPTAILEDVLNVYFDSKR